LPHILRTSKAILSLGCALVLCLGGCASVSISGKDDPRPVGDIISRAEQLVHNKAYAAAAEQYAAVLVKEPAVGHHYLRRAEILERIDEDKEAYRTYEQAMRWLPRTTRTICKSCTVWL